MDAKDPRESKAGAPGMNVAATRRQFIFDSAKMACGVGLLGLGLGLHSRQAKALPPAAIRPPGALAEDDFLGACIRCGLCVRDCPYHILHLAQPEQPVTTGTPYFVARSAPCEMCEDIPCVKACPTGALDHGLTDINKAQMGLAVLVDHETCLNFLGLRCDVCYRVCPRIDQAITLELQHNPRTERHTMFLPTVHSDQCTGCGKCEQSCVLEVAAIKVYPRQLAKGELGSHYRIGWEEKRKNVGKSLVEERGIVDLPDRLPEGVQLPGHFDPGSNVPGQPGAAGTGGSAGSAGSAGSSGSGSAGARAGVAAGPESVDSLSRQLSQGLPRVPAHEVPPR